MSKDKEEKTRNETHKKQKKTKKALALIYVTDVDSDPFKKSLRLFMKKDTKKYVYWNDFIPPVSMQREQRRHKDGNKEKRSRLCIGPDRVHLLVGLCMCIRIIK